MIFVISMSAELGGRDFGGDDRPAIVFADGNHFQEGTACGANSLKRASRIDFSQL